MSENVSVHRTTFVRPRTPGVSGVPSAAPRTPVVTVASADDVTVTPPLRQRRRNGTDANVTILGRAVSMPPTARIVLASGRTLNTAFASAASPGTVVTSRAQRGSQPSE